MRLYRGVYNHGDDCVSGSCRDLGLQGWRWGLNTPPVALHLESCDTEMLSWFGECSPSGHRDQRLF